MTTPLHPQKKLADVLDLAGMLDSSGLIAAGQYPPIRPSSPSGLHLDGEWLTYILDQRAETEMQEFDPKGFLDVFIRIRDSEGVLRFAQRYGPLGLCEHGRPQGHQVFTGELGGRPCSPSGREPIEGWLYFAGLVRAVLSGAAQIHQLGSDRKALHSVRQAIVDLVNRWLRATDLHAAIAWDDSGPSFHLEGDAGFTFWVLSVQLMTAITRSNLYVCSGCGNPYLRERKPQAGRRNYCSSCGEAGANRDRQRIHREKKRGQG